MNEILKEYDKSQSRLKKSDSFKLLFRYFICSVLVVALGIYVGNMMFGERSLDVMLSLQSKKDRLIKDVKNLKIENARLQKEYFELKELEPDTKR